MYLLRKITYGEFSEFVGEKKITYNVHLLVVCFDRYISLQTADFKVLKYMSAQSLSYGN